MSEVRDHVAVETEPEAAPEKRAVVADEASAAARTPDLVRAPGTASSPDAHPAAPAHPVLRNAIIVMAILGALAGGFLLYEFWLTGLVQSRSQTHLLAEFKASLVLDDTPALVTPPEGRPVGVIEIPSIGVSQVMVQGISSSDTKLGPGHDPSTPAPGQAGNAVVVGRRAAYGAPFADLGQVKQGDAIEVLTRQGLFTYIAQHIVLNVPLGSPAMARQGPATRLTLITSDPAYTAQKEIAVVATMKGKGLQAPGPLPLPPPGEHPGQTTNESQWGRILLWGELLAVAIGVTWYLLRRRWSTAVTYLLAAPVLIALAFLFYGAVDTLLPPSL